MRSSVQFSFSIWRHLTYPPLIQTVRDQCANDSPNPRLQMVNQEWGKFLETAVVWSWVDSMQFYFTVTFACSIHRSGTPKKKQAALARLLVKKWTHLPRNERTGSSLNVFGDGLVLILSFFWTLSIVWFLKTLRNLKTLKITTSGRMDLPSSSGRKVGRHLFCWIRYTELFPICGPPQTTAFLAEILVSLRPLDWMGLRQFRKDSRFHGTTKRRCRCSTPPNEHPPPGGR
jgi:hypothetical protein